MIPDDFRKKTMLAWLENDLHLPINLCEPASSDASFRRYFRITLPGQQLIVMDAPPDKENIAQFIKVAELLRQAKVDVPLIHYQNLNDGFLVLEDFGAHSFLSQLTPDNVNELYGNALTSLQKLQTHINPLQNMLPSYDEAMLHRELSIFEEWFINETIGIEIPLRLWTDIKKILVGSALEQPVVCVHRDYHSRNLMVLKNNLPGVIDFQDAVMGPVTYDLVSLLRDCYVAWPQHLVEAWVSQYYQKVMEIGIIACDLPLFTRWFDLMGLQRHLKAIGIFSRLNLRDGKSAYLNDIPRTMNYVLAQTHNYPELADFHDFLQQYVIPNYPQH